MVLFIRVMSIGNSGFCLSLTVWLKLPHSQERGVAEYLKLNTVSDAKSLEHLEDISKHVSSSLDNGLDCIMHKGDTLSQLMPPITPINIMGNFIDL